MRKILISLLLASAAASPALGSTIDWTGRPAHADRAQARDDRAQARDDRAQVRQDRAQVREQRPTYVAPQASRPTGPVDYRQPMVDRAPRIDPHAGGNFRQGLADDRAARQADRAQQIDDRRNALRDRVQQRQDARDLRQSTRPLPPVMRNPVPVVSNTPAPGTQPPLRSDWRRGPTPQWSTNWRNNNRYDWQNYRNRHRSLFHIGIYYDPFGWGYSPYQIGWRMWPSYYGSNFWIDDPWMYRLPYAPPGTRWVRYWDDAVLVDTWTGEVVDVIYNFFW